MRNFALLVRKLAKATLVVVCLGFAVGQILPVYADSALTMPSSISVQTNSGDIQLADDFSVSSFSPTATVLTSISVSGIQTASFSVTSTNGLTLEYGYNGWAGIRSVAFTGSMAATNNALDSLTFNAGSDEGQAVLTVSVQEKQAGTFFYEGNGNLYTYFPDWGISYADAKAQAAASTLDGIQGHLVTITSQGEQDFVNSKIQNAVNIWIASSDAQNEGIWRVDAGPESGTTVWTSNERLNGFVDDSTWWSYSSDGSTVSGQYSNWCFWEPNNSDWGNGGEDHAVTNWNGDTCWNDLSEFNVWSIGGYVVEYEAGLSVGTVFTGTMTISSLSAATTTTSIPPTTTTQSPSTTTEPPTTTTEPSTTVPAQTTTTSEPQGPETTTTVSSPAESTTSLPSQESSTSTSSTTLVPPIPPVAPSTPDSTPSTEPSASDPTEPAPPTSNPETDVNQGDSDQTAEEPKPASPEPEAQQPETGTPEEPVVEEEVVSSEDSVLDKSVFDNLSEASLLMASISSSDAEELFSSIDENSLSVEEAAVLVAAVQSAPTEVREVFEDTVDLFSGIFDGYKMLGSTITVGQRRTVVAVTAMTVAMSTAPIPAGSTNGSTSRPDVKTAARKEDDEEEPSGEIAGDGLEWIRKIRIFKHVDGVVKVDWKAFVKKFAYGVMNMGFTLAGSLVVYLTLSGTLQKIAGVATVLAFAAALWLHMKEPNDE